MGASVLVVEADRRRRDEMGSWLEADGFDVLGCQGPSAPDYTCVASYGGRCALEVAADVIVLDLQLASDDAMAGTPGWELLLYYMERGDPIVALSTDEDPVHPRSDEGVIVLRRPVGREELINAVSELSRSRVAGGKHGHDLAG